MVDTNLLFAATGLMSFTIEFVSFSNPSDKKATGLRCDNGPPTNNCDLVFEICISEIGAGRYYNFIFLVVLQYIITSLTWFIVHHVYVMFALLDSKTG